MEGTYNLYTHGYNVAMCTYCLLGLLLFSLCFIQHHTSMMLIIIIMIAAIIPPTTPPITAPVLLSLLVNEPVMFKYPTYAIISKNCGNIM